MTRYHSRNHQYKPFSTRRQERKYRNRLIITFIILIILAYSLFNWVIPWIIGSASLINQFKNVPKKQQNISETVFVSSPVLNIPYEATNSSSINLKGYSLPKILVEIYLDDTFQTTVTTQEDGSFVVENINLVLGTNNIHGVSVDDKNNKSSSSKNLVVIYDNESPILKVSELSDNQTLSGENKKIAIKGNVDPNDTYALSINGIRNIFSADGSFNYSLELSEGDNDIEINATDKAGNTTKIVRRVIYQP